VTPFGAILKRAVEKTPSAVGGAFADSQGEMVDGFSTTYTAHDWAIMTATYGVVLAHLHAVFGVWHYGGPEFFIAEHVKLCVVVVAVDKHYFAMIAIADPTQVADALASMREAAGALKREMM